MREGMRRKVSVEELGRRLNRTAGGVRAAYRLYVGHGPLKPWWRPEEVATLRREWNELSRRALLAKVREASGVRRSWNSVLRKARELRLPVMQGWVSPKRAEAITGFHQRQLVTFLEHHPDVPVRLRGYGTSGRWVARFELTQAAQVWWAGETILAAAQRLGVATGTLRRRMPPGRPLILSSTEKHGVGLRARYPRAFWDELAADLLFQGERISQAARRLHIDNGRLSETARSLGFRRSTYWMLTPADWDKVAQTIQAEKDAKERYYRPDTSVSALARKVHLRADTVRASLLALRVPYEKHGHVYCFQGTPKALVRLLEGHLKASPRPVQAPGFVKSQPLP